MDFFKNWIIGICGATILISLISALIPRTRTARLVRVCGAIILIYSVFAPLKTIHPEDIKFETNIDLKHIEHTVMAENERFEISIIEDKLGEYVLQRAKQLGVECEVNVSVEKGADGKLFPRQIEIYGNGELEELKQIVEKECGVKPIISNREMRHT